jgi:hypothetical protein
MLRMLNIRALAHTTVNMFVSSTHTISVAGSFPMKHNNEKSCTCTILLFNVCMLN